MRPNQVNSIWNPERTEFLRDCIAKNMTGSTIAKMMTHRFKETFTRNSIIGKAHREKIVFEKKIKALTKIKDVAKPTKKAKNIVVKKEKQAAEIIDMVQNAPIMANSLFKNPRAVPTQLLDLREGQCRYPEGDVRTNNLFFCGAPADTPKSRTYCSYCYPVMYQPLYKYRQARDK